MTGRGLRLVAVGASWGGLEALGKLLSGLRPGFSVPVAIVQHRSALTPDGAMQQYLSARCLMPVIEAEDKEPLDRGRVYLGPPDYHLLVEEGQLSLSLDAPVAYSRPSVDVLFETAAESYGAGTAAVVLTGANSDGSAGAVRVREAGGVVLVQDPAEAERPEMPTAAIAAGAAHHVLRLQQLAAVLNDLDAHSRARTGQGPGSGADR